MNNQDLAKNGEAQNKERDKQVNTININGEEYVRKADIPATATLPEDSDGRRYCIVRTYSAGVFAGWVAKREGQEATLLDARRIWYWDGAASLSELALRGTAKPQECKFPAAVPEITLTQVIEIIPTTEEAKASIEGVLEWTARD